MTPHTYEELKRIENVREDEIGMIAEPFFAKGYLTGRRGCPWHIIGMEKAMQQCIPPSRAHEWDAYKHGWERLLKMVEEGDLVLLFVRDRPPMIPAFRNVNGQWEVDFMWYPAAQWRFEHFLRDLRLRRQEQERRAQQATPRRREELPLDWVTLERPTLGPHDTGDDPPVMVAGLGALKGILQGAKKAGSGDKTPDSQSTAKETKQGDFIGKLRGNTVQLSKIELKKINYVKRDRVEYAQLAREFDAKVRKDYLKSLVSDSEKIPVLRKAGLNDIDLDLMRAGRSAKGWEVHHKIPLDDGGSNRFDNLVLIRKDPEHMVITNAQKDLAKNLQVGQDREMEFPIPSGFIYPVP